jgi:hypothetical protein
MAVPRLHRNGYQAVIRWRESNQRRGVVFQQSPAPGRVPSEPVVVIVVSKGQAVPNVVGMQRWMAVRRLHRNGYQAVIRWRESNQRRGVVFQQSPQPGTFPLNPEVVIIVSKGRALAIHPLGIAGMGARRLSGQPSVIAERWLGAALRPLGRLCPLTLLAGLVHDGLDLADHPRVGDLDRDPLFLARPDHPFVHLRSKLIRHGVQTDGFALGTSRHRCWPPTAP